MLQHVSILRTEPDARALWNFLKANWRAMSASGKPLAVTVQQHKARRNNDQNRLYRKRLNHIAAAAWIGGKQYSAEVWHEQFKRQFIGMEELPDGSKTGISTTTLSVAEFADYITQVEAYAATDLAVQFDHQP